MTVRMKWSALLGLTLAMTVSQAAGAAPGIEDRCQAMGSNCLCSDPLMSDATKVGSSGSGDWLEAANPSSVKKCGTLLIRQSNLNDNASSGFPSGASVSRVWQTNQPADKSEFKAADPLNNYSGTIKRHCARWYFKFNPGSNIQCNNKLFDIKWNDGAQMLVSNPPGNFGMHFKTFHIPSGVFLNSDKDSALREWTENGWDPNGLRNCESEWCRIEACTNADDVPNNMRNVSFDGYVETIGSRRRWNFSSNNLGNASGGGGGLLWLWSPNLWRPGSTYDPGVSCSPDSAGRKISHIMHAQWPTNSGQYIGAASEIEGGGGGPGPGPGPGPATPPAPPTLLP